MAKTDREVRQLKSNVQSLQSALAAIAGDIEPVSYTHLTLPTSDLV